MRSQHSPRATIEEGAASSKISEHSPAVRLLGQGHEGSLENDVEPIGWITLLDDSDVGGKFEDLPVLNELANPVLSNRVIEAL